MSPSERLAAGAAIALHHATDTINTATAAAQLATARRLNDAATDAEGISVELAELLFESDLALADTLIRGAA